MYHIFYVERDHIRFMTKVNAVADSVNHLMAKFTFDTDVSAYSCEGVFTCEEGENAGTYNAALTDGVCAVPWQVLSGTTYYKAGVYFYNSESGVTFYTNKCTVDVDESCKPSDGTPPGDPPVNMYEDIKAASGILKGDGAGGVEVAVPGTDYSAPDHNHDAAYVAKETGKGLSAEDYTTTEKTKLFGIEPGAQVNPTALKNPYSLTAGEKTYDGSVAVSLTAADIPTAETGVSVQQKLDSVTSQLADVVQDVTIARADLNRITGCKVIALSAGVYYVTSGATVNINDPKLDATWDSAVVSCDEGDEFYIIGQGGSSPRLWCFIKADGTVVSVSVASTTGAILTAPADSAYLVCNFLSSADKLLIAGVPPFDEINSLFESDDGVFIARETQVPGILDARFYSTKYKKYGLGILYYNYGGKYLFIRVFASNDGITWPAYADIEVSRKKHEPVELLSSKGGAFEYDITINWDDFGLSYHFSNVVNPPQFKKSCTEVINHKDELLDITGCEIIPLRENAYYAINGATVDINAPINEPTWASAVVECVEGDRFTITGQGGSIPKLWCFADSLGNILDVAPIGTVESLELSAPADSAYLVVNFLQAQPHLLVKGYITNNQLKIESYSCKDHIKQSLIVDVNGHGDYTTIHEAYAAITDSSFENQYEVIVFPGTYNENNLIPPAYTHTHGLHPNSVIITSEGLDTTYSVIDQRRWSSKLSNLTVISYTKYCVHYDQILDGQTLVNENLHLIQTRAASDTVIGGGTFNNGTKYVWINCIFEGGDVHCHTSGSQANYNNTHNLFKNCKLVNARYYAQSSGSFGHCVYEIDGTNTKAGEITVKANLVQALRTVDEPWSYFANGCEWQIIGANNKNVLVDFVLNDGESLQFETANVNESLTVSGTAVGDLFGHIRYKSGNSRFKGTATGICLVKDEKAAGTTDVYQMWKRLGDCSSSNKTLSVTVGGTTQTYTFDQNYLTDKTAETALLSAINAVITVAVLKKHVATTAWENINLEEKQYVKVAGASGVAAGEWLTTGGTICADNEKKEDVYGIALENGVLNEVIPVWTGNVYSYTAANGEYGIVSGVLDSTATEKIGKIVSNVFIRY